MADDAHKVYQAYAGPSPVVLRCERLTKQFGNLLAVDDLSLEVHQGEIFGFLGPNGAGKTTSIQMMCGLLQPTHGNAFVFDRPVFGPHGSRPEKIGMCPQQVVLWNTLTCLEQLEFVGEMYGISRQLARNRGLELLEEMGLSDKRDKIAKTLSGGMQRRLSLIIALIHDPDLIVLDEPEAGLDPQSRVLVRDYVKALVHQRGKTVLLTSHNMDEVDRMADRIAIIDRGRLLLVDSPEQLKSRLGQGDVVEIELNPVSTYHPTLAESLGGVLETVSMQGNTLIARAHNAVEVLPAVFDILRKNQITWGPVRLRGNSLEDVFISLTGRALRE